MLKGISIAQFVEILIILACVYYLVVLMKYYRKEIRNVIRSKFRNKSDSDPPLP